jgi:outer membrane protein assembly factor BamB
VLVKARSCGLLLAVLASACLLTSGVAMADVTDQSVAYQVDAAHDGWLQGVNFPTPLAQEWSDTFAQDVSYPLVVNGTVYVTAVPANGSDSELFALSEATGNIVWQQDLGGQYTSPGLAYDAGRVFAVDSGGLLVAYNATSGTIDWASQLPGQYMFSSPPTASGGIVYVGGAGTGGTLYATSEATGALLWSQSVANGDNSSPAVDASQVYVSYPDNYYAFNRTTGALDWHDALGGDGGGGRTPVVADGYVFIRDFTAPGGVFSASDGSLGAPLGSTTAPAVANGTAYELDGSLLEAVPNDGFGPIAWTFSGDGQLDTAPLVIGSTVWVGSASGELYAVDGATGQQLWSTDVGTPILGPDENDAGAPAGLAAGDSSLLVSAGKTLVAFAASGATVASPAPAPGGTGGTAAPEGAGGAAAPGAVAPVPGATDSINAASTSAGAASSDQRAVLAQAAALRHAISKRATVRRILADRDVQLTIKAQSAGRVVVEWFVVPAGTSKQVLLAIGRLSFARAGSRSLELRLSALGERTLARTQGGADILASAEFVRPDGQSAVAQVRFRLGG